METVMSKAAERLLDWLPAIYRQRDDGSLRALLELIGGQLDDLDADLAQLYDNWFIETCEDWAVPYIGDLLGVTPSFTPTLQDPARRAALLRSLVPRQEVANTLRARRRKGSFALLGDLARDVAGWPAQAVEFQRQLLITPSLHFPHPERSTLPSLRNGEALSRLSGPFNTLPRLAEARSPRAARHPGRYGLGHVGLFLWRLVTFPLDLAPAGNVEEAGPQCFTFSVLGNDAPLYVRPDAGASFPEGRLPVRLSRTLLRDHLPELYGKGRSLCVWTVPRLSPGVEPAPVSAATVRVANLRNWAYRPERGQVAIDPHLGRIVFHPAEPPTALWVSFSSAFSAELGGGPYLRAGTTAAPSVLRVKIDALPEDQDFYSTIENALDAWETQRETHPHIVIELCDHGAYTPQIDVTLRGGESLYLRAASGQRPSVFLLDRHRNSADPFTVRGDPERPGGCLKLEGLLITGRAVHLEGPLCEVQIRHSTLVPGWGLHSDCEPTRPTAASLELYRTAQLRVEISHSILGSIQVELDEVRTEPIVIELNDSILDATGEALEALGAPTWPYAHARLSLRRCTVFGQIQVERIDLIEDSLLVGLLLVARRGSGCVRYSSLLPGSRTPRRTACQPDRAEAAVREVWPVGPGREQALEEARRRVRPTFLSTRYGQPLYARLRDDAPPEVQQGAQDEGEQGAFHDLFEPQRLRHLQLRLDEFTPASIDASVLFSDQEAP